jgi:hypothetical protein
LPLFMAVNRGVSFTIKQESVIFEDSAHDA